MARDPDEAQKQFEISLKRLNTDHVEVLNIHDVQTMEDVEKMSAKGQLVDVIRKYKEQGITRYIGFTGHTNADALKEIAQRAEFDTMLVAMNHWRPSPEGLRQEIAIPAGKEKKMGVLLMKVIRPKETIEGLDASELVRYALSLDGPDALVIGMDRRKVLDSNLGILRDFNKLSPGRMKVVAAWLTPFYHHEELPWMKSGYTDGLWHC
jgi:predicted aldo/keto reductase-like oxidoreductase